jgi:hypothetical protein
MKKKIKNKKKKKKKKKKKTLCKITRSSVILLLPLFSNGSSGKTRVPEQWHLPNREVQRRHSHVTGCMTSS